MRVLLIVLALFPYLLRAEATFSSGERQIALVELFTSEGCSSCPPADQWMSRLRENPGLWRKFVPVGWHVDYWNGLGWPDPYSKPQFTARQREYAREWGETVIYTPAMVLDGKPWRRWKNGAMPASNGRDPGNLEATVSNAGLVKARFRTMEGRPKRLSLTAVVLISGVSSPVRAGENRGRNLRHDFTVLESRTVEMAGGEGTIQLKIPEKRGGKFAVAVWVTQTGSLAPIQATGGWIKMK